MLITNNIVVVQTRMIETVKMEIRLLKSAHFQSLTYTRMANPPCVGVLLLLSNRRSFDATCSISKSEIFGVWLVREVAIRLLVKELSNESFLNPFQYAMSGLFGNSWTRVQERHVHAMIQ
jgi:hypothetical protein